MQKTFIVHSILYMHCLEKNSLRRNWMSPLMIMNGIESKAGLVLGGGEAKGRNRVLFSLAIWMSKTLHLQKTCNNCDYLLYQHVYKNKMSSQEKTVYCCILMRVWMKINTVRCAWVAIKILTVAALLFLLSRTVVYWKRNLYFLLLHLTFPNCVLLFLLFWMSLNYSTVLIM